MSVASRLPRAPDAFCPRVEQRMTSERQPLVSVITAAYNNEQFLGEAIQSILAQTYPNFEMIVVDDASTDQTLVVARRYAAVDSRVRVLANERRMGAAGARNRGVREARGEFIAILDADDVALPERLAITVPVLLDHPEAAVVGSGRIVIDEEGEFTTVERRLFGSQEEVRRALREGRAPVVHSSALVRASAMREVGGYDEFFRYAHDMDLWTRLADRHEILVLPEPVVKYRVRRTSISMERRVDQVAYARLSGERAERARRGETVDLHAEFERIRAQVQQEISQHASPMHRIAHWHLIGGQRGKARRAFLQALREDPRGLHHLVEYLLTFVPEPWGSALRRRRSGAERLG
jgi:glycosyltransferase involved in cell wall biosynthesis